MRQQFVQVKTAEQARRECPWAEKVVKADGGYWCFESAQDYETWRKQK